MPFHNSKIFFISLQQLPLQPLSLPLQPLPLPLQPLPLVRINQQQINATKSSKKANVTQTLGRRTVKKLADIASVHKLIFIPLVKSKFTVNNLGGQKAK